MERFFIQSCSIDKIVEIEELLLRKYSNIEYILDLEFYDGIAFLFKAIEVEKDEKLWDLYLEKYKYMTKDNFISFEEFKNSLKVKKNNKTENLTVSQIEDKVKKILSMNFERGC